MKIQINYDLLERIKDSKNGMRLDRYIPKWISIGSILTIASCVMSNSVDPASPLAPICIMNSESWVTFGIILSGAACRDMSPNLVLYNKIEEESLNDLDLLISELNNIEVKTSLDLIKGSKLYKTKYKIKFTDNKPMLMQEKYITVPLSNGYEESLLQEHKILSKNYELSVVSPVKRMKLKPVIANL